MVTERKCAMRRLVANVTSLAVVCMVASTTMVDAQEIGRSITPITGWPSSAGSSASDSPATVGPPEVVGSGAGGSGSGSTDAPLPSSSPSKDSSASASSNALEPNTTSPTASPTHGAPRKRITFNLILSPSSNEAVDLLEIVQNDQVGAPRISFESMPDKNNWGVDKWEDPLTQLGNMITNDNIEVAHDDLRLDVRLNDPARATKVSFKKKNPWQYGPTLVLHDAALKGLTKLTVLEFSNFNVSFEGSHWLPANASLSKLTFDHTTVTSFSLPEDAKITDLVWRGSVIDSFPTSLLNLKTPPSSLIIESSTFSQPLTLNPAQVKALQNIPHVVLSKITSPAPNDVECVDHATIATQAICVTAAVADSGVKGTGAGSAAATQPGTDGDGGGDGNEDTTNAPAGLEPVSDQTNSPKTSASRGTTGLVQTIIAVVGVMGAVVLIVGFIWVRRRPPSSPNQASQLTFTNHSDKFLTDLDAQSPPPHSHSESHSTDEELSVRTTVATIATGLLSEVNLGAQVITRESRLGANGLWRAEYREETTVVALRVEVEKLRAQNKPLESIISSCLALRHPHIIDFLGTSLTAVDEIWLVAEFMAEGSLRSVLRNPQIELPWETVQKMSLHIATALAFVQSTREEAASPVVPTLSSRSVLCDGAMNCKLDVFEFSKSRHDFVSPMRTFGQGEIAYRAPELLTSGASPLLAASAAAAAEVYAFGVILCELSHHALLYSDILDDRGTTLGEIFIAQEVAAQRLRPEPASSTPSEYIEIISACVALHPDERATMKQVVDWLTEQCGV